jgi:radical SAM superfamily enzyme YgiQ (UPF0313 family)
MPALPVVHLVHPPPYGEVPFKHLGLCYVAAGLRSDGFDTRYHDLSEQHHRSGSDFYDALILRLSRHAGDMSDLPRLDLLGEVLFPELADSALATVIRAQVDEALARLGAARAVCISFNTLTSYFTAALGKALRQQGVVVLLGGPLAGYAPVADLLLHLGTTDALIAGDGDLHAGPALRALLAHQPPSDVPGARWLENGVAKTTPPAPPPALDLLPRPLFEGNVLDSFIPLQASRGCGRSCAYCSESGIWGPRGHRRRTPARVAEEMTAHASAYGLNDFHFHDDLLNGNRRWMDELVRELSHGRYTWESFFEPYGLDANLLGRMRDAGCRLVKYGIQSFSPTLLRTMKRPPDVDQVVDVVVHTYRLGISTHFDMLIGHPGETEEDHRRNLALVEELFGLTGERLYFSLNPFYLSAGSEIERHPDRFHTTLRHATPEDHVAPMAVALRAVDPYPEGYQSDVPRDTTMRRMDELSAILRRHGKDYLYLGQQNVPGEGTEPRTMLPDLRDGSHAQVTVREARAAGDADLCLPAIVLREDSNLRLFPDPGRVRVLAGPARGTKAYVEALEGLPTGGVLRILGGEATLDRDLAPVLAAARRHLRSCVLETNGLRFSQPAFTKAMVRYGLSHAVVLLLGLDAPTADELGGVAGSFDLALEGARQLIAANVPTEVGLVLTERTVNDAHRLSGMVSVGVPGASQLRVVVTRLRGTGAPPLPDPSKVQAGVSRLLELARQSGQRVVLEDRG